VVALVEIIPVLVALACLLLAAILAVLLTALIRSIAGVVGKVPFLGDAIVGGLTRIEQAVWHALGVAFHDVDKLIGAMLHADARLLDWTWNSIRRQAALAAHMSAVLGGHIYDVSGLRSIVHGLQRSWHGIEHGVKTLTREYHGLDRRVKALEHTIGHGIGNDVRTSVHDLVKWEKAAKAQLKADEKAITQTLPGELTQLENFIKAIPGTRYLDWAAGIVAAGLGLEVLKLFKCPTFLSKTLGRGCGLWNGLEDLFGLFLDALIFVDLCAVIPEAVTLFGEVEAPLTDLISSAANAVCAHPPQGWAKLSVAAGPTPPPQTLGTFPV
jgi:hypothetical protein